jgi:HPt (histidine-containing phosphotransfer) domain-containing protein
MQKKMLNTAKRELTEAEEFEQVRQSFLARLSGELERLATLAKELEAPEGDYTAVLSDIAEFAHRLQGAAAIFDAFGLSRAARAVELAATADSSEGGKSSGELVRSTVGALADALAIMIDTEHSARALGFDAVQTTAAD